MGRSILGCVTLAVVAGLSGAIAGEPDGRAEDGTAAFRKVVERFYTAWQDGDREAILSLLPPAQRERSSGAFASWPPGATFSVKECRAEGDWGLALVELSRKGEQPGSLPLVARRTEGEWSVLAVSIAAAELPLLYQDLPSDRRPDWMGKQLVDWTVEAWERHPGVVSLEAGESRGPIAISPDGPLAFLVRLEEPARVRIRVDADGDIEPSVALVSPDGSVVPCSSFTKRHAENSAWLAAGVHLANVATTGRGKVTVLWEKRKPASVRPNLPVGPVEFDAGGILEFELAVPEAAERARFQIVPIDPEAREEDFFIGYATKEMSTRSRGLATEIAASGEVFSAVNYRGTRPVKAFAILLVDPWEEKEEPRLRPGRPVTVSLVAGEPRFLRLAPEAPAAWQWKLEAGEGGPPIARRVMAGVGTSGVILSSETDRSVTITLTGR